MCGFPHCGNIQIIRQNMRFIFVTFFKSYYWSESIKKYCNHDKKEIETPLLYISVWNTAFLYLFVIIRLQKNYFAHVISFIVYFNFFVRLQMPYISQMHGLVLTYSPWNFPFFAYHGKIEKCRNLLSLLLMFFVSICLAIFFFKIKGSPD